MPWLGQQVADGIKGIDADGNPAPGTPSLWYLHSGTILTISYGYQVKHNLKSTVGTYWSVSRKMGTTQILGITLLGICLVSPQFSNAYVVPGTDAATIASDWVWNFGSLQSTTSTDLPSSSYSSLVHPGLSLSYLEIFWPSLCI